MEHPPYSLDLAPNDFQLFPKIKSASKGQRFRDSEDIKKKKKKKKYDDGTESSSTTGIPKMFPTVAASLD
jgi:hypothetical protein